MSDQLSETGRKTLQTQREALLVQAERFFPRGRIPKRIREAFLDTPRHLFIDRYYSSKQGRWVDLLAEGIEEHLLELYADHPLGIYRDEGGRMISTISQPSLVLYMLELLDLQPSLKVFELGCGSGWNAAMMGRLVGPEGRVVSAEIIESLAASAKRTVESLGLRQVTVVTGDGSEGIASHSPYQRGVFTASSWELPAPFFEQIEDEGLLLLVLKLRDGVDLLSVLRKRSSGCFESDLHFPCSFVSVMGARRPAPAEPINLREISTLEQEIVIGPDRFSWLQCGISSGEVAPFIEFLRLARDCQRSYLVDNPELGYAEEHWGLISDNGSSLALFNEEGVKSFGTDECLVALRRTAKRWSKAGRPELEDLSLRIHQSHCPPASKQDQWLVRRGECVLEWSLSR